MYTLGYAWTKSFGAAFVAGLLFAFHPARISDPVHLNVVGNAWTPLALLLAHRLFQRRRWRDAAGLTFFAGLQMLESFYPLFTLAIIAALHGFVPSRAKPHSEPRQAAHPGILGRDNAHSAQLLL
jgi:hypothetical protein